MWKLILKNLLRKEYSFFRGKVEKYFNRALPLPLVYLMANIMKFEGAIFFLYVSLGIEKLIGWRLLLCIYIFLAWGTCYVDAKSSKSIFLKTLVDSPWTSNCVPYRKVQLFYGALYYLEDILVNPTIHITYFFYVLMNVRRIGILSCIAIYFAGLTIFIYFFLNTKSQKRNIISSVKSELLAFIETVVCCVISVFLVNYVLGLGENLSIEAFISDIKSTFGKAVNNFAVENRMYLIMAGAIVAGGFFLYVMVSIVTQVWGKNVIIVKDNGDGRRNIFLEKVLLCYKRLVKNPFVLKDITIIIRRSDLLYGQSVLAMGKVKTFFVLLTINIININNIIIRNVYIPMFFAVGIMILLVVKQAYRSYIFVLSLNSDMRNNCLYTMMGIKNAQRLREKKKLLLVLTAPMVLVTALTYLIFLVYIKASVFTLVTYFVFIGITYYTVINVYTVWNLNKLKFDYSYYEELTYNNGIRLYNSFYVSIPETLLCFAFYICFLVQLVGSFVMTDVANNVFVYINTILMLAVVLVLHIKAKRWGEINEGCY